MIIKTQKEMTDRILSEVEKRIGVNASGAGTIVQTFTEVLVEDFYDFYEELNLVNAMAFLSTSEGVYVDLLGDLLNCPRQAGEADGTYKQRIRNQVYTVAGGNLAAIRLKALAVPGVSDITIEEFTNGPGSFTCHVFGMVGQPSAQLVEAVRQAIANIKSYGIEIDVRAPKETTVALGINVMFKDTAGASERAYIRDTVGRNVATYINGLEMNETLIINEVIQVVMGTNDKILDCELIRLDVNDQERLISNVIPGENERFVVATVEVG